jgi:hypothetical protein
MRLPGFNKTKEIEDVLKSRFYLKNVEPLSQTEFKAEISLNWEALELLFHCLTDSVRLRQVLGSQKKYTTEILFDFKESDIYQVLEELDFAYQKTVYYLDNRDLNS